MHGAGADPVSYTHLDVYKRQRHDRDSSGHQHSPHHQGLRREGTPSVRQRPRLRPCLLYTSRCV
ncbi:hypothetical protein [Streptomyces fragilis]|uniref:hypothetical protein n=1 Tax=Streptomyces fragilis TaxID=67301 RepID=UPI0024DE51A3|nr:hypothetical protein [Streptomyces fragilis]